MTEIFADWVLMQADMTVDALPDRFWRAHRDRAGL
jgi:hypothetical protein